MYAEQYEITLPAGYDMRIIRERVARAGHLLDDRAGLGLKAYLIRERGSGGSPVNQYAPFYLWNDVGAAAHFLVGGGGFQGIVRDFGRPPVQHWTGLAVVAGPARATPPAAASRLVTALPADPDPDGTGLGLSARIAGETGRLEEFARREGVHTAALALDARDWRLLRFVLWQEAVPADEDATERYEVLHLSAPGLDGLTGRTPVTG
ncbi:DUF4865 family protein [Streptosporangium sp. NPDC023615]|uniref:DUF4865 family protein n=1 Tax=Streptosporangium sp. NPDC023615 TaxID=3154794 RepID=UPI00342E3D9F